MHVLIIGGGTGGMCLAHGLKQASVSVAVYERDRTRSDGLHGDRVGINPIGNRALQQCLPRTLFATFIATCARSPRYFNVLTEKLRFTATVPLREPTDPVDSDRSVSRMTPRQVLFTGMDNVVAFDKVFTHHRQHDNGTVEAFFADGSSASGDVLVAATGPTRRSAASTCRTPRSSPPRSSRSAARSPSPTRPSRCCRTAAFRGCRWCSRPRAGSASGTSWSSSGTATARSKGGIGGNDAELIEEWPRSLFNNTRDYISGGFWASSDKYPPDVMDLRGKDLIRLVLDMTPGWHPNLRRLLGLADPASCFPDHNPHLGVHPAVAAHQHHPARRRHPHHDPRPGGWRQHRPARRRAAVPPAGRRPAGRQAAACGDGDYEAEMVPYGFARVAHSVAQNDSGGNDPLHKPVVGRVMLAATRTYFRAVDRIPAARRKFLNSLYTYRNSKRRRMEVRGWSGASRPDGLAPAGPTRPCPPRPSHPTPAPAAPPVLRTLAWLVAPTSPHVREADSSP